MTENRALRLQLSNLKEDWRRNRSFVSRLALANYRIGRGVHLSSLPSVVKQLVRCVSALINVFVVVPSGTAKLYPTANIGPGLTMAHRMAGSVIHPNAQIGARSTIFHHVTIGNAGSRDGVHRVPIIGDDVTIYPGAIIVGTITVGSGVTIGPNALVNQDIAPGSKVVAPRATILRSGEQKPETGDQGPISSTATTLDSSRE